MQYEYVLKDFYTEEEKQKIWTELQYLRSNEYGWLHPNKENNACDADTGEVHLKDAIQYCVSYKDVMDESIALKSSIYVYGNKIWKWHKKLTKFNQIYYQLQEINNRTSVITYYPNNSKYNKHRDCATFTMLSYFYREPKNFTGGEFIVEDRKYEINNGFTIIIPSFLEHGCAEVNIINESKDDSGRFCVANFFFQDNLKERNNPEQYFLCGTENLDGKEVRFFDPEIL